MRVEVYTKPGCQRCDAAVAFLEDEQAELKFDLQQLNILTRADWFEAHRYRVPVVRVDGVERAWLRVDEAALRAVLRGMSGGFPS